jgi:PIN domain nuclease of toxin-antitoxin system
MAGSQAVILLDTCTLLWLALEPEKLSPPARTAIAQAGEFVFVSAISAWEIAWKHRHGRLRLQLGVDAWFPLALENHALRELGISATIALRMAALPEIHRDPADRFLIATAQEHRLTLLTPDPLIRQYADLDTLW